MCPCLATEDREVELRYHHDGDDCNVYIGVEVGVSSFVDFNITAGTYLAGYPKSWIIYVPKTRLHPTESVTCAYSSNIPSWQDFG